MLFATIILRTKHFLSFLIFQQIFKSSVTSEKVQYATVMGNEPKNKCTSMTNVCNSQKGLPQVGRQL